MKTFSEISDDSQTETNGNFCILNTKLRNSTIQVKYTLGPAYNELGYSEHLATFTAMLESSVTTSTNLKRPVYFASFVVSSTQCNIRMHDILVLTLA